MLLVISFTLERTQIWRSFVKIIMLNKTCKYHKLVFVTELIFFAITQNLIKNPISFLWNELSSGLADKNTSSLHHSISNPTAHDAASIWTHNEKGYTVVCLDYSLTFKRTEDKGKKCFHFASRTAKTEVILRLKIYFRKT